MKKPCNLPPGASFRFFFSRCFAWLSPHDAGRSELLACLLSLVIGAIAVHGLSIHACSLMAVLPYCWVATLILILATVYVAARCWRSAPQIEKKQITAAWASPWPWLFIALMVLQIVVYPPAMHDSLCYRLPRLYLALQEGSITRFSTPDWRMNTMPWGWELVALPFASLNILGWSRLINLVAWAFTYQLLFSAAFPPPSSAKRARLVALALATPIAFVFQASSTANDFFAAALLLAGVWMIRSFHAAPRGLPIMVSLLALILAANIKPQFLILGIPWLAWWMFAPSKPWKLVSWKLLALAFPAYLMLSPIPILASNFYIGGSLLGEGGSAMIEHNASPAVMVAAGFLQFLSAQLQLPFFPSAEAFSSLLRDLPGFAALHQAVPKFLPGVTLIPLIDSAGFGLIHFILLGIGIAFALKRGNRGEWFWCGAVVFSFVIAASQVVPGTIGRSFLGFLAVLLPTAAVGLAGCSGKTFTPLFCRTAIMTGFAALIVNPSSPLWPSHTLQSIVKKNGMSDVERKLEKYHSYMLRAETGTGILDPIPAGDRVGLLLREFTPVAPLWSQSWQARRLDYVNDVDPEKFATGSWNWLVVGEKASEQFPELMDSYTSLPGWEKVSEHTYLPNINQGYETWTLFRKLDHNQPSHADFN